jgi:hypothetical protein
VDTLTVHPYGHRFADKSRQEWVPKMVAYEKLIALPELEAGHIPQKKVDETKLAYKVATSLMTIGIRNPEVRGYADEFFMQEVYGPLAAYMGTEGAMVGSEHTEKWQHTEVKPKRSFFSRGKD